MNNDALEAYGRQAERVARLLAWLRAALERHYNRVVEFSDEPARLWPAIGSLAHVEAELKSTLSFIAAVTEEEIDEMLNGGGQGNV